MHWLPTVSHTTWVSVHTVESLLQNDVTYGCGKSIHSNFHSPYKESKDSRYIRWLWLYEQVSSRHRASSKRNLLLQSLVVPGFKRGSPSFPPSQPSCTGVCYDHACSCVLAYVPIYADDHNINRRPTVQVTKLRLLDARWIEPVNVARVFTFLIGRVEVTMNRFPTPVCDVILQQ